MRPNANSLGFYPISAESLNALLDHVVYNGEHAAVYGKRNATARVLDPCAGEGEALQIILERFPELEPYGVELSDERAAAMKERFKKEAAKRSGLLKKRFASATLMHGDMLELHVPQDFLAWLYYNPPYNGGKWEGIYLSHLIEGVHYLHGITTCILYYHNLGEFWRNLRRAMRRVHSIVWLGKDALGYDQCALNLAYDGPFSREFDNALKAGNETELRLLSVAPHALRAKAEAAEFTGRILDQDEVLFEIKPVDTSGLFYMQSAPASALYGRIQETVHAHKGGVLQDIGAVKRKLMQAPPSSMLPTLMLSGALDGLVMQAEDPRDGQVKACVVRAKKQYNATQQNVTEVKDGTIVEYSVTPADKLVMLFSGNVEPITLDDPASVFKFVNANRESILKAIQDSFEVSWDGSPIHSVERTIERIDAKMATLGTLNGRSQRVIPMQRKNITALAKYFMDGNHAALLAAEQGTGKTLMSMAVAASLFTAGHISDKQFVTVICPPFLVPQWKKQLELYLAEFPLNICALALERASSKKKRLNHEIFLDFVEKVKQGTGALNILIMSETDASLYGSGVLAQAYDQRLVAYRQKQWGGNYNALFQCAPCAPNSGYIVEVNGNERIWITTEVERRLPDKTTESEFITEPLWTWQRENTPDVHYKPLIADLSDKTLDAIGVNRLALRDERNGKQNEQIKKAALEISAIAERRKKRRNAMRKAIASGKLTEPLTGLWRLDYVAQMIRQGKKPEPLALPKAVKLPVAYWFSEIAKRNKGICAMAILDEAHRGKNPNAGRSTAMMSIASRSRHALLLTATPMSGYASTLHLLGHLLSSAMRSRYGIVSEFGVSDAPQAAQNFAEDHGAFQVEFKVSTSEMNALITRMSGSISTRREAEKAGKVKSVKELPGISYRAVAELLSHMATARMVDIEAEGSYLLPPFEEHVVFCKLDEPVAASIEAARAELRISGADRTQAGIRFNWGVLGMAALNAPHEERQLWIEETDAKGNVRRIKAATYYGVPIDMTNKERDLAQIVAKEIGEGRGVCVYTTQINVSRNIERLVNALSHANDLLAEAGSERRVRPFILESDTDVTERIEIVEEAFRKGCNVLITNPALVEVGVNLLMTPTLIYTTAPLNFATFEQSRARARRLNQQNACRVYYLLYEDTAEMLMHALNAGKLAALLKMVGGRVTQYMEALIKLADLSAEVALARLVEKTLSGVDEIKAALTAKEEPQLEIVEAETDLPKAVSSVDESKPAEADSQLDPELEAALSLVLPNGVTIVLENATPQAVQILRELVPYLSSVEVLLNHFIGAPMGADPIEV